MVFVSLPWSGFYHMNLGQMIVILAQPISKTPSIWCRCFNIYVLGIASFFFYLCLLSVHAGNACKHDEFFPPFVAHDAVSLPFYGMYFARYVIFSHKLMLHKFQWYCKFLLKKRPLLLHYMWRPEGRISCLCLMALWSKRPYRGELQGNCVFFYI